MSDELEDLLLQEKATAEIIEGAAIRVNEAERQRTLAEATMAKGRERLSQIRNEIKEIKNRQPVCLFEDEAAWKCTTKAAWKIQFPHGIQGATSTGGTAYEVRSERYTTYACHDHLSLMADDYSGSPALVSAIRDSVKR